MTMMSFHEGHFRDGAHNLLPLQVLQRYLLIKLHAVPCVRMFTADLLLLLISLGSVFIPTVMMSLPVATT